MVGGNNVQEKLIPWHFNAWSKTTDAKFCLPVSRDLRQVSGLLLSAGAILQQLDLDRQQFASFF